MVAKEQTTKKAKSTKATGKAPLKVAVKKTILHKKSAKAKTAALKQASKSKVRLSRAILRAEKADKKNEKGNTDKRKVKGHAPHSSRISPVVGPVTPLASQTLFAPKENSDRNWILVDAAGHTVGRLASEIAMILRGKNKAVFTPNNDAGDFVVVINADKVKFKGNKEQGKTYNYHSGYIGGLKTFTPAEMRDRNPTNILRWAVHGMVPRNPLGRLQMKKLKIYTGAEHPHAAQNPVTWQPRYSKNS